MLENYINILPTSITIANGKNINAIGLGNINLHTSLGLISLSGVLYVDDIGNNLLSVASIVDQGFQVEFSRNRCTVSNRNTERVIAKRQGNIYFVTGLQVIALAGLSQQKDDTTREVWHKRIAHRSLNEQASQQIVKSVTGFDLAENEGQQEGVGGVCAEGKQARGYLTGERPKTEELLHTIHSDVCRPMAIAGIMGEWYFGTFIDEGSGRIAISLLIRKSEVFKRFKQFKAKVERESGKKIESLRCDGGGEYRGNAFRNYLTKQDITQRMTTPYTLEHNGIAKRGNHTIMHMVRCMLFDSGMGKEFWGFAALTAVHIVNRLPSTSHKNKTPFEKWFGKPPSSGHLQVFGWVAYRHRPSPTRTQRDPKAQRCRMLGYREDSGRQVYRLLDETSSQVVLSRDVLFDENRTGRDSRVRSKN